MPKPRPKLSSSDQNSEFSDIRSTEQKIAAILKVIRSIPVGRVESYGGVARRAQIVNGTRLVCRALREHDDPDLPWQRVIRSDGTTAVPSQQKRLKREGVLFAASKVRAEHWWTAQRGEAEDGLSLDRTLWLSD